MSDAAAYAFTIYFVTLGPLKAIPAFALATRGASRRTVLVLAAKSVVTATAIVLFVALVATGSMATWRVSADAMAIAGGLLLIVASGQALMTFRLSPAPPADDAPPVPISERWLAAPVLSPLAIPAIVTPVGVVAILFFSAQAFGDAQQQRTLLVVLMSIMAFDFVAMLVARPVMRAVRLPVLQVVGWVFAALQAGLGVEAVIAAVRRLSVL
jgi:multiple antibiotic resistance protein